MPHFSSVRPAHTGRQTVHMDVATNQSKRSEKFVTCARDGSIFVWKSSDFSTGVNPQDFEIADGTHSTVIWRDYLYMGVTTSDIVTSIERRSLVKVDPDTLEIIKTVFTFAMDVTCVDVSRRFIVAGSSDCVLKCVSHDSEDYVKVELDAQPLSLALDPEEQFCAVSCTDGSICIYSLEKINSCQGMDRLAKVDRLFGSFGDVDVSETRCRLVWSRDGRVIFVPTMGRIKVIQRYTWNVEDSEYCNPDIAMEQFSILCISSNGLYLACATLNGSICVWDAQSRNVISLSRYHNKGSPTAISSMIFDPANEQNIVLSDIKEGVSMLYDACGGPLESKSSVQDIGNFSYSASVGSTCLRSRNEHMLDDEALENEHDNDIDLSNDEDSRFSVDIGALKKKYELGEASSPSVNFREECYNNLQGKMPLVSGQDIITFKPPALPRYFSSGGVCEKTVDGLKHRNRYLRWNKYGVVRYLSSATECTIEIEYSDASICAEIVISNEESKYTMADLGPSAVALASRERGCDVPSELYVDHHASWDNEKRQWQTKLPFGDGAMDVLITDQAVIVLTESGNLRFFTLCGTQRHVISHPGHFTSACAFEDRVAVSSVVGGPQWREGPDGQHVHFFQYEVTTYVSNPQKPFCGNSVESLTVPVPYGRGKEESVAWMGFSNTGNLVVMDGAGTLRLLTSSGSWIPIFDASSELRSKSDAIWPISVSQYPRCQFRYLYCRGSRVPLIDLKSTPIVTDWKLPLCDMDSEKSRLESEILMSGFREVGTSKGQSDAAQAYLSTLIKLFALAAKSEREGRAAELATFCESVKGLQLMCNYASKQNRQLLSNKVQQIGQEIQEGIPLGRKGASSGRENESVLAPLRVSVKKRESLQIPVYSENSNYSFRAESDDNSQFVMSENCETETQTTTLLTQSITPIPTARTSTFNPFKRSLDTSTTTDVNAASVFEKLESSVDARKRQKEITNETTHTPRAKQARLCFASSAGKENTFGTAGGQTAFTLWLSENENRLRSEFVGEENDFAKFCQQSFRMLPAPQKKEWRSRAAAT